MSRKNSEGCKTLRLKVRRWLERWMDPKELETHSRVVLEEQCFRRARLCQLNGLIVLVITCCEQKKIPFFMGAVWAWLGLSYTLHATCVIEAARRGESTTESGREQFLVFRRNTRILVATIIAVSAISCWLTCGEDAVAKAVANCFPSIYQFSGWWIKQVNCFLAYLGYLVSRM